MQQLPRPATPPRLSRAHVGLQRRDELGPDACGDDELLTELEVGALSLEGHDSQFVEFASLRARGGSLSGSRWHRTNWVDVELRGLDAANADLTEAELKRVAWSGCRMVGFAASGCSLHDVLFEDCGMAMAALRHANLERVEFRGCDLSGADLTGARLRQVWFVDCDLSGTTFAQARSDRVVLRGGRLEMLDGLDGLRGARVHADELPALAPRMAQALGLLVDVG